MAHSGSAAKQWRASLRRRARNRPVRTAARTYVSKAAALVAQGAEEAATAVRQAVRALDKAAQKGVIHPNNAARRKSRLMKRYNLAFAPAREVEAKAEVEAPKRARRATPASGKAKAAAKAKPKTTARAKTAAKARAGKATKGS